MKKTTAVLSLLLLTFATYWSFRSLMPNYVSDAEIAPTQFSTDRALAHVATMSQEPHGVGFPAHKTVRDYVLTAMEDMGLEVSLQEGHTAGDWANYSKATNILARIKGTGNGKALLLLSHYDSSPHSSLGASDAGSGVATILEGLRAFLATEKTPKNDIIILISDAEELGLNGADLFVKEHPWVRDVGLVLNFEARGSGGPSYMLLETNRGNSVLIQEFVKANPDYPVANSLAYSIYKMLPNDTDLTVFREDADIEGFNFAFIDDHFDYHTQNDSYDRLDRKTLAHQGSYLMPLLWHFSEADLDHVKSLRDHVYFNVPFFKMIYYPFDWIMPMLLLACILFIYILYDGFKKKVFHLRDIGAGFLPALATLAVNGLIGYFSWPALKLIYPGYNDILHGFPYNGHAYIVALALLALGVCFYAYHKLQVVKTPNLLVAPICLWLVICALVAVYLKGAAFIIIPVFSTLVGLYILVNQKHPNAFLMAFLALPAVFIFAPFIKMFPVGLGLKMMVASTVLTTLTFFLLLPLIIKYRNKRAFAFLFTLLGLGFLVSAHLNSDFNEERPKPSSLLYVLDTETNTAKWATYERQPSFWTSQYLGESKVQPTALTNNTISSKYGSGFSYTSEAPVKAIAPPKIEVLHDTMILDKRYLEICITPRRDVNRLEVFSSGAAIQSASINGIALSEYYLEHRRGSKLVTHYISDNAYTELRLGISPDSPLELTFYEASNDLLQHPAFSIPPRPATEIPMPFVLNDAILTIQKLTIE
jgi:hypothetical protein